MGTDETAKEHIARIEKMLDKVMLQNAMLKKKLEAKPYPPTPQWAKPPQESVPSVPSVPHSSVPSVPSVLPESNSIGSLSRILDRCESVSFSRKRVGEGTGQTWQLDVSVLIPTRGHEVNLSHVVNSDEINNANTDALSDQLAECIRRLSALIVG